MIGTLIILYALDAITGAVPVNCFVATWVLIAFKFACNVVVKALEKRSDA